MIEGVADSGHYLGMKLSRDSTMSKIVESFQADVSTRIFRVTNGFNEAVYLSANEPSLGMYRLQEHVQIVVPKVVSQKQTLRRVSQYIKRECSEY